MPKTCGSSCASPRSEGWRTSNTDAEGQEMIVARERKGRRERERVSGDEEKMEEG